VELDEIQVVLNYGENEMGICEVDKVHVMKKKVEKLENQKNCQQK